MRCIMVTLAVLIFLSGFVENKALPLYAEAGGPYCAGKLIVREGEHVSKNFTVTLHGYAYGGKPPYKPRWYPCGNCVSGSDDWNITVTFTFTEENPVYYCKFCVLDSLNQTACDTALIYVVIAKPPIQERFHLSTTTGSSSSLSLSVGYPSLISGCCL
ncbi:MAG: hypothetical protein FE041_04630 [Thermoplasmata archaeon]|nr:MAG: hypothetical protein FE041_04630 [Thermoplasmata archaeon]